MVQLYDVLLCSATMHILMTAVMALFARHKVEYLSLAWILGIFGFSIIFILPFANDIQITHLGIMHPMMLIPLLAIVFLQSIYPLSISMPGYLQWNRMWGYAVPVIVVIALYVIAMVLGMSPVILRTWSDFRAHLVSFDVVFRIVILLLSIYYVINIFRLPKELLRLPDIPNYIIGYTTALGLSSVLYIWVTVHFNIGLFELWIATFTLVNLYIGMRVLETIALNLPKPEIKNVESQPEEMDIQETELADFNEANRKRFERVEFWMQHNPQRWKDYTFGRDQLCAETSINRHLLLQSLRSQGYNNVHEYINTYRIYELVRLIDQGQLVSLRDCIDAGFGTIKTARTTYEKIIGGNLDEYLASRTRR